MSHSNPPSDIEGAIYEAALSLEDPETRRLFLERSFHGDPAGLEKITRLLESARDAATFFLQAREQRASAASGLLEELTLMGHLEAPASPSALPAEGPGTRIGRYRIIARIGEGGGGVVYEAEQEEPMRRRVAIKVIRIGMDTEAVIARFEIERQALALMDHPNIARVLDGGATVTGRPYFVMELVAGEKITTYCDRLQLPVSARLALFIQVCSAIQHAHQKGIIHRDIKPSNILITTRDAVAIPKVIDFGIAKATGIQLDSGTVFTAHDQFIGTPAYMSPEQIDMVGIDVDTRSDIYSLGVLLYELLTSRTPLDGSELASSGISMMRRTLLDAEHAPPSRMLASRPREELADIAARRHLEPGRLISSLRGDLDWIVMKAMEKNRNRRYQTVNSLSMDVQRFLANDPVLARPPGKLYLTGKFIRRNRVAFASGVAVSLSLITGLGASTWLYLREREALAEQERLWRVAEISRAEESLLRQQAQARANVSRVAVLLSEGQIQEADMLLQETPLVSIEPSREAADVFRSLGNWNATYGRWAQAQQCFILLNQANRFDDPWKVVSGSDLLYTGPALVEAGDLAIYESFRQDAVKRYLPVRNSFEAEHLLKVCLLTPCSHDFVRKLEATAKLCAESLVKNHQDAPHLSWEAFSLALYHHRLGESAAVLETSKKGLEIPETKVACKASFWCLMAMAHHRQKQPEKSQEYLAMARTAIGESIDPVSGELKPSRPWWFDWSVASILLREADREVKL